MMRVCPRCNSRTITLTARRRQLLDLLVSGLEDKEIAQQMAVAPSSVRAMLQSLYSEVEVHNRVQLAVWFTTFRRANPDLFEGQHS